MRPLCLTSRASRNTRNPSKNRWNFNMLAYRWLVIGLLYNCWAAEACLDSGKPVFQHRNASVLSETDSLIKGYCGNSTFDWTSAVENFPVFCNKTQKKRRSSHNRYLTDGRLARMGEFPSFARLTFASTTNFSKEKICGGTVIDRDRILTAANCIDKDYDSVQVQTGIVDLDGDVTRQQIRYGDVVCTLNGYTIESDTSGQSQPRFINDVAILQVFKPFRYDRWTQPACLELDREVPARSLCYSVTMGRASDKSAARQVFTTNMRRDCVVGRAAADFNGRHCWQQVFEGNPCDGYPGSPMLCIDTCEGGTARHYLVGAFSYPSRCDENKTSYAFYSDAHKLRKPLRELLNDCREPR